MPRLLRRTSAVLLLGMLLFLGMFLSSGNTQQFDAGEESSDYVITPASVTANTVQGWPGRFGPSHDSSYTESGDSRVAIFVGGKCWI